MSSERDFEKVLDEIMERWGPVFEALRRYDEGDPDYLRGLDAG